MHTTKYWTVRKALVAFAFFGGHRTCELRNLKIEDLEMTKEGIVVTFERAKQRKCPEDSKYLIPFTTEPGRLCWGSLVKNYVAELVKDTGKPEGDLFKTARNAPKAKFTQMPIGRHTLGNVGKEVARLLLKTNPDNYTGK
jgi:integrase